MDEKVVAYIFNIPLSCVSKSHVANENNKKFIVKKSRGKIFKIKLDYEGRDISQKTVDYAFLILNHDSSVQEIVFVELKGIDVKHGFEQIESSLKKYCEKSPKGKKLHNKLNNIRGNHDTKAFVIAKKYRLQPNQNLSYRISKNFGVIVNVKTQEHEY
ncbi:MAG: hypothetical protein ACTSQ8_15615 [Candidatus Helarchaeota archaeon]